MFDHLGIEEKAAPAQPDMDAPLPDSLQPPVAPQPEAPKPAETEKPAEDGKTEAAKPAEDPKTAWQPKFNETKHFKRPEDVEVAYVESSKEGRRLAGVVKETETALEKVSQELGLIKMQQEIGPELKDLTEEQMSTLTPQQVAMHVAKQSEQKQLKARLEEKRQAAGKEAKQSEEQRTNLIVGRAKAMERDAEKFPEYKDCMPLMDELLDWEPGIAGHPNTPMILYLAAQGIRAAEAKKAGKAAAAKAAGDAKTKAASDASAAGGTGAPGSEKTPAGTQPSVDPSSDLAHNMALVRGNRPKPVFAL